MVAPGDELPARIDGAGEGVEPRRAIVIMLHVLLARPQELDRHPRLLCDPSCLDHVVVVEAPPKSAARARQMNGDRVLRDAERFGHEPSTPRRLLRRPPDFQLSVAEGPR